MRRLDARLSDSRNKVSKSRNLGKKENCAGRNICRAERNTSTAAAKLVASRRSSTIAGNGTIITKTRLTAAMGTIHSINGLRRGAAVVTAAMAISGGLPQQRQLGLRRGKQRRSEER